MCAQLELEDFNTRVFWTEIGTEVIVFEEQPVVCTHSHVVAYTVRLDVKLEHRYLQDR